MTTRQELDRIQQLISKAKLKGINVPLDLLEEAQREYIEGLLDSLCHGRGTDEDVLRLVEYYWPKLLESQEIAADWWQCRIIRHILSGRHTDMKQVAIKGCTRAGKGFAVAAATCLWFESGDECKVIVTSDTTTQARKVMFGEILKLRLSMAHKCEASEGQTEIKVSPSKYMIVISPEKSESMSGQHGPATLFLFDEASGCREEFWALAETQAAMAVALSNPRLAIGWYRALFPIDKPDETQVIEIAGGRRSLVTIGGLDCINVQEGRLVIPSQIDRNRYESIKAKDEKWGRVFGDGQFPLEDETLSVVLPSWLERHFSAWTPEMGVCAFGLDMAASESGDRTELATGGPGGCHTILERQSIDTMSTVGWVLQVIEAKYGIDLRQGRHPIAVDMDGLGKGAGDRLAEEGCWVLEFRGNARSEVDPKTYGNLRSEAYGELGARLNPAGAWPDEPWALPRDGELAEDLCAQEKVYSSDGFQWKLIPKSKAPRGYAGETLLKKLGRSPDKGDSLAYLYYAVRHHMAGTSWQLLQDEPIIASGEEPEIEHKPFNRKELEELPDWLRELVEESRKCADERDNLVGDNLDFNDGGWL